jgi:hypothetical protein
VVVFEGTITTFFGAVTHIYIYIYVCVYIYIYVYKARSKKDRTFAIKSLFYNILSTVPFKVVPSICDTPFPTFRPLLECVLERTFCDGAQFSYRIFLNLRLFKKRPNFLNKTCTSCPSSDEQLVHVLISADVARRLMVIAKRGKWQFVVEICRAVRSVAIARPPCWLASYLKSSVFFNTGIHYMIAWILEADVTSILFEGFQEGRVSAERPSEAR